MLLLGSGTGFTQNNLPAVKIRNLKGQELTFNSLFTDTAGTTIVSFWATWCGPCIKELEAFNENLENWQTQLPVKLIAVSVDDSRTANNVKTFVRGRGWNFPVYQDVNNDLKRALNIPNVPHTLVIKNGRILFQTDGYESGNEDEIMEKIIKAQIK
jgi:thiol-disulfide isomerase/thioredoxin